MILILIPKRPQHILLKSIWVSFLLLPFSLIAQNGGTCTGYVKSTKNEPIAGATIQLLPSKTLVSTDESGKYVVTNIPSGNYTIKVKSIGYKTINQFVKISESTITEIDLKLEEETHHFDDVEVLEKSETQEIKEQAIKTEVIDTKQVQQESASLSELMNRAAGIRVRQMGGLGSSANVMVNGYQGKAIKYFKDGIPLDYFGEGFNVNLVPVNMLDRVEIYKGVLPAKLGADALGGAVNMVTKTSYKKYLDVSYEFASFNTHRASLNTFYRDTTRKVFIGLDAFFNHSDNSYNVTAKVVDPFTRTRKEAEVTRFHDGFTNYYAELYGGVMGSKWADLLRVGVTYFRIDKQEQHGALMTDAYGQVSSNQYSVFPTLRYKKALFNNKFEIDQFLVYNTIRSQRIDTCNCTYDWYGNRIPSTSRQGESDANGALPTIYFSNFTSRTYLTYRIHPQHKVEINGVYSSYSRVGNDPFGPKYFYSGRDILSAPAGYNKLVISLGFESVLFKNRITHSLIGKYYRFGSNGTDAAYSSFSENQIESSGQRFGIADAIKILVSPNTFFRLSGEYATRLPEQSEVFGDGLFTLSNFNLRPEQSTNLNLGFRTQTQNKFSLEINSFYRVTKDLILQVPIFIPFSQYQNVEQVKGIGGELDANVNIFKWLTANGNVTYQDLRLFEIKEKANQYLEGARLRNTPFFFGNLGLRTNVANAFYENTRLQAYLYYTYVHEYYLENIPKNKEPATLWEKAQFDSDLIIPSQNLFTGGINYSILKESLTLGFEVKNIFNTNLYDNFRVQKAGRSFHLKLRYVLK